ncbi:MAG: M23 family metallopeptidase [Verrucomicrobiota bacterium]
MRGLSLLSLIPAGLAVFVLDVASLSANQLIWPTPNPAFARGEPLSAYVQPTSSGILESGLFGCVRNGGYKFHEGLDLFPVQRDKYREALDDIYAILPGRVKHVSRHSGHSSYGRYVVVVHESEVLPFYSLYAHLASVPDSIQPGTRVEAGAVLGRMGRSAAGYTIPKSRAHLHLEVGLKLTDDFQAWYDRQKYKSSNRHGVWNGMNLVGVDPLKFYELSKSGQIRSFYDYLQRLPVAARIRVYSSARPSFIRNYEALMTRAIGDRQLVAWDIAFTPYGLPKAWTPRFANEGLGGQPGDVEVLAYNPQYVEGQTCRRVLDSGSRNPTISSGTLGSLKKLFGFR